MKKQFEAVWPTGYIHTSRQVIGEQAICEARGYSQADIQAISTLEVGQAWQQTAQATEQHTIRRMT